jgi:putative membrane protein
VSPLSGRAARVLLVGVVLPLLAAGVLVWSTDGREAELDRVPVAVVNDDTIITGPQPMAAGRALTAALTEPGGSGTDLDWTLTDTHDATAGLRNGDYYAVLTIPSDFSAAILSSGTDSPVQGHLQLRSNAAASTTVPYLSEAVASAAASALGDQTTQGYLGQVYAGFNQLASGNEQAASSAAQLAMGTDQLVVGAEDLDEGVDGLASGLTGLADGAAQLATAAAAVAQGTRDVAAGSADLAEGAERLDAGAADLARSARTLATGEADLAGAARRLVTGAERTAAGAREVAAGNRELARSVARVARLCDRLPRDRRVCRLLDAARAQTRRLAAASADVADGSVGVAAGAGQVASGATALAGGARRLAGGAGDLDRATARLSGSASRLSDGAGDVARGAGELDEGAGTLASGASASADGARQLATGSSTLSSTASELDQGARELSSGLAQAASQSPTYSEKQRQALEPVVSEPVVLTSTVQHTAHGNGWLVGLVMGVVLWLTALVAVSARDVTGVLRHADAPVSSGRLASLHLAPAAGIAVLQASAVVVALPLLDVSAASTPALALVTLLAAVVFTLTGLVLRWWYGLAGLAGFVLLLALQAAALGNVVPLETAPEVMQRLNGVMPLTAYVDGASRLVSGGEVGSLVGVVVVLLTWGAVAALAAVLVVRRRRVRPALSRPA